MQKRGGFFFQAEDGIRDHCVTGVQTCALPICSSLPMSTMESVFAELTLFLRRLTSSCKCLATTQIGRASCRERV